jgi:hypothetical protein
MLKTRLSLSTFLFGGMAFALFAILTFTTIRNIARDKATGSRVRWKSATA